MISNSPNRGYSLDGLTVPYTEIVAIEGGRGDHLESGQYMAKQSNGIGRRTVNITYVFIMAGAAATLNTGCLDGGCIVLTGL